MATILRSLRFIRRMNTGCRRLGQRYYHRSNFVLTENVLRSSCTVNSLHANRTYVTEATLKRELETSENVDDLLQTLDSKIKWYGYVLKPELEKVLQIVESKGTMTPMQALLLIRCCGYFMLRESAQTRQLLVNEILKIAAKFDVAMDVSHYNALLLVYLDNETNFSPLEFLLEMKNKGVEPNRVTYQRLIEQYCKNGDVSGATKILEYMSQHEIPLNESIFHSLIIGHSEADDVPSALKMLDIMQEANIEPTSKSYSAILCVHAKRGDIISIRSIIEKCKNKEIIFHDKELLNVIYTLAINNHDGFVDEVITNLSKISDYNRMAFPIMCKLIDRQKNEVAYKLQKSLIKRPNDNYEKMRNYDGMLFLRKLMLNNCSEDVIIEYCNRLINDNINEWAFEGAAYIAFRNDLHHLAVPLFKAMKKQGREIREHYFSPLFVYHAKNKNLQGILSNMKIMISQFEMQPMIRTVKEYIVPYMVNNPVNNLSILIDNGLTYRNATNAIFIDLLQKHKTQQALNFLKKTPILLRSDLVELPLTYAFLNTKDVDSLIKILHYVTLKNNESEIKNVENTESNLNFEKMFLNYVINKIANKLNMPHESNVLTDILDGLLNKGLRLEQSTAEQIQKLYGNTISDSVKNTLLQLTSENLQVAPLDEEFNLRKSIKFRDNSFNNLKMPLNGSVESKMFFIQKQCKLLNYEEIEKLLKEFEEQNPNITYPAGFCATILEMYCKNGNIDEADKWYKLIKENESNWYLNKSKVLRYAKLLVENNRWSDAWKILEEPTQSTEQSTENLCANLMQSVNKHCHDQFDGFFNKLKELNYYSTVTSEMISPLIHNHIEKNELEKALEKFKWACENFKITPLRHKLMKILINKEDPSTLQYVTELCTKVHGETNTLVDLSIGFLECDRPKQAIKILQTPGLRLNNKKIMNEGMMYYKEGKTQQLEKFIKIVSSLQHNSNELYELLLKCYARDNDWQKSLLLWTEMQDDNIQPSEKFMNELEKLLKINNQEIPFVTSEKNNNDSIQNFSNALKNGNASEAQEILENLPKEIRSTYYIQLINHYLNFDDVNAALTNLKEFWKVKNNSVSPEVINDTVVAILKKLCDADDFKNIELVLQNTRKHTQEKNSADYAYLINSLYYKSDKFENLFEHLDNTLQNKIEAKLIFSLMYDSTHVIKYLRDKPIFEEKLKQLAFKAKENNIWTPMNTLWLNKLLNNSPDTESFFKENITNFQSFKNIRTCKNLEAWDKFPQLCKQITEYSNFQYLAQQRNADFLLNTILSSNAPNKYDLAYECLSIIVKVLPLDSLSKTNVSSIEKNYNNKEAFEVLRSTRNKEAATG